MTRVAVPHSLTNNLSTTQHPRTTTTATMCLCIKMNKAASCASAFFVVTFWILSPPADPH